MALSASTSTSLQFGQSADTASRSSDSSGCQSESCAGSGEASPLSLTFLKQRFAVVHAGRPYALRNTLRSASALGSSPTSTIATVSAPPAVCDR